MIFNLEGIERRRSRLIADIDRERINLRGTTSVIRQDLLYASLGLMAGKLSSRHVLLHGIILAIVAIAAIDRLIKKSA
jgi:hypothetical protein